MNTKSDLIVPMRTERERPYSPPAVQGNDAATIMQIIERMVREATFDPVAIREMLAIKKEYEADEARKAYAGALADFKENEPAFFKTKHVDYGTGKAKFDYAPIAEVVSKLVPALATYGLTHKWVPKVSDGKITVLCVLTHRLGHSDSVESPQVPPNSNPAMSVSQNIQATITFWQRMTLQWITGTAAEDMPDVDDRKEDKPAVGVDVWTGLGDAAEEGEHALRRMWDALSDKTRDIILEHYAEDWDGIKAKAMASDARRSGIDTAQNMRRIMKQDIDEKAIAQEVATENARLNRSAPESLNAAWELLNADERRAWKAWNDQGKKHERK